MLLLNVLEHVPHPEEMLTGIWRLLEPGGLLYIRVPNDFNPLQAAAQRKLGAEPWWIAVPDHVNYFDVESLCALTRQIGFEPVDVQADFPMELFLLMGLTYIGDPEVGARCHAYRVEAERSMEPGRAAQAVPRLRGERDRPQHAPPRPQGRRRGGARAARRARRLPLSAAAPCRHPGAPRVPQRPDRRPAPARADLTEAEQERWFDEVVVPAQRDPRPPMMLVSILDSDGRFIGYGGLTNLDWDARRAEVSFLVDPARAADLETYRRDTLAFLAFLADWAFGELGLNRLFTETFDFREFHIGLLEQAGFEPEGRMREHVTSGDSVLHGLLAANRR